MTSAHFRVPPGRRKGSENGSRNGAETGPKMEPKWDPKGTETEILLNTNHEESSYGMQQQGRIAKSHSGLFLGVKVEERARSRTRTRNSNSKLKPELHDNRTRLQTLATRPRDPSLAELPLHSSQVGSQAVGASASVIKGISVS